MTKKRFIAAVLLFCAAVFCLPTEALALRPTVGTSEVYRESEYYTRLTDVELTGNYRRDLVAVALSQVGYHEGDSKDDYAGSNLEGTENFIEYANAYHGMDGQWCAMFVTWCARQANIPKIVINNACAAHIDNSDTGKYGFRMTTRYKKHYTPIPGDLVFFTTTGWGTGHVGIVVDVTEHGIYTVEGNAMNAVRVRYYPLSSDEIVYYGVYSWQKQDSPVPMDLTQLNFACVDGKNGHMPDGDPYRFDTLHVPTGTMLTLPIGGFAREGYTLAGYYLRRADGAWYCDGRWRGGGEPTLVRDGESWLFDDSWAGMGALTLYCVWQDGEGNLIPDSAMSRHNTGFSLEESSESGKVTAAPAFARLCSPAELRTYCEAVLLAKA